MTAMQEDIVLTALRDAEECTAHALAETWQPIDGLPAQPRVQRLLDALRVAEQRLQQGESLQASEFRQLLRWLSDWIPDTSHPVLGAVSRVERALAGQEDAPRS